MNLISKEDIDLSVYSITATCVLTKIHVQINDTQDRISAMIRTLRDTSWISRIPKVSKRRAYEARAVNTINILVNDILSLASSNVTKEAGEYIISMTAQDILELESQHAKLPLAELWKEQKTGNPGFDFHTESISQLLFFGEAKYKTEGSPYNTAITAISKFAKPDLQKHIQELCDLEEVGASEDSVTSVLENKIGVVAAFALNAQNIDLIFDNAINLDITKDLLNNSAELFLIGIEICS